MWGEGVNIRLRAWGWEHMLVYMCACRLRLCVRSGLRLRLTHHLSRPPPHHHALPVEDAAGALVISRAGAGCSGERRPTLGGRLAGPDPTGLAGPRLGGGGPLGLRAQGPVRPGVVGCRWSLRACRHGTLGVWGPGLFRACFMPCGMGLLFPTHTIKRLHGGTLWTQARSHTQVYTQAFTLV